MGLLMIAGLILCISSNCKVKLDKLFDQAQMDPIKDSCANGNSSSGSYSPNDNRWNTENVGPHKQNNLSTFHKIERNARKTLMKLAVREQLIRKIRNGNPESFDPREKWTDCKDMLNIIKRQGHCGSCWAFSTTYVLTARMCIHSKGKIKFEFSPEDALQCCGHKACGSCSGGFTAKLWQYAVTTGIVSGGDHDLGTGCKPVSTESYKNRTTLACSEKCSNSKYDTSYEDDRHFAKTFYEFSNHSITDIEADIMTNGPLVSGIKERKDFNSYKSGIYQHDEKSPYKGEHAIVIIGWGKDEDKQYWLAVNSYGKKWGMDGFFKIIKGINECGVEDHFVGGLMNTEVKPHERKDHESKNNTSSAPPSRFSLILLSASCYIVVTNFPFNMV